MFLWYKALHLIFMVMWFAGLFYLPRLFVYHCQSQDSISDERFKVMERKLFWGIMTPGGILTLVFGLAMLLPNWDAYASQGWMHTKITLVGLLIAYHIWCLSLLRSFKKGSNIHSHTWYRWFNEIPTIGLVAIILLAVLRPY